MKILFGIILSILMLAGCASGKNITEMPSEEMTTFQVYYGDDNAEILLSKTVRVNEINAHTLLAALVAQDVIPEDTQIQSLKKEGSQLTVDFNNVFQEHLLSMGTAGERILIGSVVNTFLNALHVDSVVLTVNGNILESGHMIYNQPLEHVE